VVTVNVNGIRAAARRGGLDWLHQIKADVICLQEVRATHAQLHEVLSQSRLKAFHVVHAPAPQLGRAGVAILTKDEPLDRRESPGVVGLDDSGRWVEADINSPWGPITVVSVYVHTGEAESPRQEEKYAFLDVMDTRLKSLRSRATRRKGQVIVCGDLNIAHREIDIKNWRGNLKSAGFLPQERAYLDRWFQGDWTDLGRALGGPGPGPYTWWSWRGRGFDTDGGWRIDYVLSTAGLAERAKKAVVGKAPTYAERWSDHAPLTVTFS
jgi:exodeoxyribonuclease-3